MADLKEENPVDANEENQVEEITEESPKTIDPNLVGIQLFYEKNKKAVNYIGGGLLLFIAAFTYLKLSYLPEQENEASNEMFWAESLFERDSFNMALKGGYMVMSPDGQKLAKGFEQIAEEYNLTKSGNLANYYAGICYLRTGKYEQAIECLKKYNGDDEMVSSIAIGATGDAYMELNKVDDAVKYYLKASENSNNIFTTPYYLKKAGFAYETKGDYKEALGIYERIQKEYGKSNEAREIVREIAKLKAMANL